MSTRTADLRSPSCTTDPEQAESSVSWWNQLRAPRSWLLGSSVFLILYHLTPCSGTARSANLHGCGALRFGLVYILAQIHVGFGGCTIFGLPLLEVSAHLRPTADEGGEWIATFG